MDDKKSKKGKQLLYVNRPEVVAVLVDGGFFIKRYKSLYGKNHTAEKIAEALMAMCWKHVGTGNSLYRIFYYDSIPFEKKVHNPITKKVVNFAQTPQAIFRRKFFEELKKKRKTALRLGYLKDSGHWNLRPKIQKDLLNKKIIVDDLSEDDVVYELRQKCIDMKIGIDISSLALKHLVNRIVLIAGDADFVPASKLARREGIDFILDPMWNPIDDNLFEHIDGLKSMSKPKNLTTSKSSVITHSEPPSNVENDL